MKTEQIQIARFHDGGFVLHKVTSAPCEGRCSAWFDAKGGMLDAEQFDSRDRARPVKRNGPVWQHLQIVGKRYVKAS